MLKHLAIVAVAVILAVSVSGQPNNRTASEQQPSENQVTPEPACQHDCYTYTHIEKSDENPPDWHTAIKRPEWWLVGVGIITFFVIGWQACLMRKHADELHSLAGAARDNAQAARLNAQAIINTERPWILVEGEATTGVESSAVVAKNCGRTPAQIVRYSWPKSVIVPSHSDLPLPPDYGEHRPFDSPIILLPEGKTYIKFLTETEVREICKSVDTWNRVQSGELELYIFGVVYYEDLLNSSDKASHETGWCCRYLPGLPYPGNHLVLIGGPGYNYYK